MSPNAHTSSASTPSCWHHVAQCDCLGHSGRRDLRLPADARVGDDPPRADDPRHGLEEVGLGHRRQAPEQLADRLTGEHLNGTLHRVLGDVVEVGIAQSVAET
jgi:hypothetical protein